MKKNIFYLFLLCLLFSCAVKKPEKRSRFLKGFYTQYNTLFNANDALNTELETRNTSHKDNFYAPYIKILTYDDQPLGSDLAKQSAFIEDPNLSSGSRANKNTQEAPSSGVGAPSGVNAVSVLEIAEAKAIKAINRYSVIREGQEKNKKIFDAFIILVQSRIYMDKPLSALDAINQYSPKFKNDKRLPLANIYKGVAYAKMGDYYKANEIFSGLKTQNIKKEYQKLLSIYSSESLLASGKKEDAIKELNLAFSLNKNKKLKSRISFLRGQVLLSENKNELSRESFLSAYQYANDFEFEVKSQIEIAKTYSNKSDYNGAKDYLEKISKKGTYGSRKNEFYYALGLMASKVGKKDEAMAYFRKSLNEKVSDPQIRGLDYSEIGNSFLEDNEYIAAGAYYDSAIAVMTYEPTKAILVEKNENIKKIAKNYYLIKKNDSILALTKMTSQQQESFFSKYIAQLKTKEEALERLRQKEERNKGFDTGDYNANSVFAKSGSGFQDFGSSSKGFYFANSNSVSKGTLEFKQVWGNRALSDNWRFSNRMASIEDTKSQALGLTSAPDPRRYEPSFYIEKIPKDPYLLSQLKKDRDTASLGLGTMYNNFFSNRKLATKTLYDLVDNVPEEKVMLQALYEIFSMNYKDNPTDAARAKKILTEEYPYSAYAEFARNPQNSTFINASPSAELAYRQAFALYENEQFEQSKTIINKALIDYPKDALVPKFSLLNAFNTGKTAGKEVMILQLEQIALNYEKTSEGEKAKEMLNYLKSDIKVQMKDDNGNDIKTQQEILAEKEKLNQEEQQRILQEQLKKQNTKENTVDVQNSNNSVENPFAPPPIPKNPTKNQ